MTYRLRIVLIAIVIAISIVYSKAETIPHNYIPDYIYDGIYIIYKGFYSGFNLNIKFRDKNSAEFNANSLTPLLLIKKEKLDSSISSTLYGYLDTLFIQKSEIYLLKSPSDTITSYEGDVLEIRIITDSVHIVKQFRTWDINYANPNKSRLIAYQKIKYSDTFRKFISSLFAIAEKFGLINKKCNYWAPWKYGSKELDREHGILG